MPKAGKSSASSATRKKQAAKAAKKTGGQDDGGSSATKQQGEVPQKKMQRGERKAAKKNKKPVYIPPPKPPQPAPDPLDALGLAPLLPPDLVVLLRKASKKDVVTRARALEGLLEFIAAEPPDTEGGRAEEKDAALVIMLPCWAHLFPRLSISPTRRLRLLTAQIHAALLRPSRSTRSELLMSPQYAEPMIGPWAVLAYDADKSVARIAKAAWDDALRWESVEPGQDSSTYYLSLSEHAETLIAHLRTVLLSFSPSASLFTSSAFNPAPSLSATPSGSGPGTPAQDTALLARDAKTRDDVNVEEDADATDKRLAAGALGALVWTIDTFWDAVSQSSSLEDLVTSQVLWRSLSSETKSSSLGQDAPLVRVRLWNLLGVITKHDGPLPDAVIAAAAPTLMSSAWQEDEILVVRAMLDSLLPQLRKQPDLWTTRLPGSANQQSRTGNGSGGDSPEESEEEGDDDDDADGEDENESVASAGDEKEGPLAAPPLMRSISALEYFLDWLRLIAPTTPQLAYPAVLVIISTLPRTVFSPSAQASKAVLDAIYSPIFTRQFELEGPSARGGVTAWLTCFSECTTFLVRRLAKIGIPEEGRPIEATALDLARQQFSRVWDDFVLGSIEPAETFEPEADGELAERRRKRAYRVVRPSDVAVPLSIGLSQLADLTPGSSISRDLLQNYNASLSTFLKKGSQPDLKKGSQSDNVSYVDDAWQDDAESLERIVATFGKVCSTSDGSDIPSLREVVLEHLLHDLQGACQTIDEIASAQKPAHATGVAAVASRNVLFVGTAASLLHSFSSAAPPVLFEETLKRLHNTLITSLPTLTRAQQVRTGDFTSFIAGCLPVFYTSLGAKAVQELARTSLEAVLAIPDDAERAAGLYHALVAFRAACKDGQLGQSLVVPGMDDAIVELAAFLCSEKSPSKRGSPGSWQLLPLVLDQPAPFVAPTVANDILSILSSRIEHVGTSIIAGLAADQLDEHSIIAQLQSLQVPLLTLQKWLEPPETEERIAIITSTALFAGLLPAVVQLAYLAPRLDTTGVIAISSAAQAAKAISMTARRSADSDRRGGGFEVFRDQLLVLNVPTPAVVNAFKDYLTDAGLPTASERSRLPLLPEPARLEQLLLDAASSTPPRPSLAILDQLVHPSSAVFPLFHTAYNSAGCSNFSVCISVLLQALDDEVLGASFPLELRILPHLIAFALMLEDHLSAPPAESSGRGPFSTVAPPSDLQRLLQQSVQVVTRALSSLCQDIDEGWHVAVTKSIRDDKQSGTEAPSALSDVLVSLWQLAVATTDEPTHELLARSFSRLLSGILNFSSAGEVEALAWLEVAQAARAEHVTLSCSVLLVIGPLAAHLPKHDRLRNDMASRLAGVSAAAASTTGADLLRVLLASAPPPEMGVPLIPTQRAIFLLQTVARWLASEEEIAEEINTYCAALFVHLAPVVQDMAGAHIDLLFDLAESNLAVASFDDQVSLPGLYHGLRLIETLRDLANSNKVLREIWVERNGEVYERIKELYFSLAPAVSPPSALSTISSVSSIPQDAVVTLLTDLTRDISSSFTNEADGPVLARLVTSTAHHADVQISAYKLLSAQIREQVRELVVDLAIGGNDKTYSAAEALDAGLDTEDQLEDGTAVATGPARAKASAKVERKIVLAPILLETVSAVLDSASVAALLEPGESAGRRATLGLLLSWLAIFDHFLEASLPVKAAYIIQLEQGDTVARCLLPSCFALMGAIVEGKPFDAGRWAVDEIFFEDLDTDDVHVLQVLAGHVYLRSLQHLPTLVRNWWFSLKDRQLSSAVSSFTTRYCSPAIAARELAALREPEALSRLEDEAMSVRIMGNNEVVATYVVDEHPIELSVRIPTDFPLHAIEIRDPADASKRVGISEAQWRAWILAVQQLITSGNGLVFDAVLLFKKNAEAKFAGFEGAECAICYSIISPTDRSLPVKPCQTCKNKFHASCLFKWVNTSGSSTCPLCRSVL